MQQNQPVSEQRTVRVEAYIRPELLIDPIDGRLQTVETLQEEGVIDEVDIEVWPPKVPLIETSFTGVIDVFDTFTEWANANGVEIQPPFRVCETSSEFTGETKTVLRLPSLCLAIYVDETLESVIPHTDGKSQYTIEEAITALEAGRLPIKPIDESVVLP